MKLPRAPHRWNVTPREAMAIQERLRSRLVRAPLAKDVRVVAGLDASFTADGSSVIAAAVVWDVVERRAIEERVVRRRLTFPYVPGLLSFREAPAVLDALRRLRTPPQALICDAHGFAHPRRFGLASHVGVLAGLPSAGCAKSLLVGEHREPARRRGSRTALVDGGERIGSVLRTRDGVAPVYVSVGHLVDLTSAERLVLRCGGGFRLPEPTRLADRLVAARRREHDRAHPPSASRLS